MQRIFQEPTRRTLRVLVSLTTLRECCQRKKRRKYPRLRDWKLKRRKWLSRKESDQNPESQSTREKALEPQDTWIEATKVQKVEKAHKNHSDREEAQSLTKKF